MTYSKKFRVGLGSLLLAALFAFPVHAQETSNGEQPKPVPKEYASPQATLLTFLTSMNELEANDTDAAAWKKVYDSMDLPMAMSQSAKRDQAWSLLGVLNKLGEIDPATMAPGTEDASSITSFEFFPNNPRPAAQQMFQPVFVKANGKPNASIVFEKGKDGAWRISRSTIDNLNLLVAWARPLEYQHGGRVLEKVQSEWIRQYIPGILQNRFFLGIELWQWLGLAIAIFAALALDLISRLFLSPIVARLIRRFVGNPDDTTLKDTIRPMGLSIGAIAFRILLAMLGLPVMAYTILDIAAQVVCVAALTWAAWMLSDLISSAFQRKAADTESAIDDMIIPLLRKTAKLFILAMGVIYIADSFGVELLPLMASFGIAGLAISFAAQDMVKNLFGGLAIFMDRPFKMGERVKHKGYDGIVEEIGFRITRLRTLEGHQITLPNASFTVDPVENIGRRPSLRRILDVTITYDTPKEKIEQAVQILKDILQEPGIKEPIHQTIGGDPMHPRIYFNEYNAASLNIRVMYWHVPADWWMYQEHGEKVNLRIFEEFEKAGIEFAFPTQTLYLAGDPNRALRIETKSSE